MGIQENIEHSAAERAKFREMKEGTAEDWAIIGGHFKEFAPGVADRVLDHLRLLD
ncbi:MAG: phosphohydrolase, partial [Betaproteobacteria bacterium]|nr:phosphohydrolase [Betaproteobacteria bacterium]